MAEIFVLFLSIKGRINFYQLERYGQFTEQRYRQQFEKPFDFMEMNKKLAFSYGSGRFAIAFDPSYIGKSGKLTPGLGRYWSGCAQASKWGLEISGIAAVDVDNNFAFHLEAVQPPGGKGDPDSDENLLDWYGNVLFERKDTLVQLSCYILADAYFAKKAFVNKVLSMDMHLVSRLRDDAHLKYLFGGEKTGKKGRPRKHEGKIDWQNLNPDYFNVITTDGQTTVYSAIVYSKSFKRDIKIACEFSISKKGKKSHKIYFSTDLEMEASAIIKYYRSRFQIEFLYRDGKQHTALEHSQARSENKLHFHFNASLTTINIARVCHWLSLPKEKRDAFSMADVKTLYHNMLLLQRFIDLFAINPNKLKNQDIVKELIYYGTIAA
ncbi:MAG: transposase [Mangrovibacterium sp.]